ncbi:hypothetical protein GCM10025772_00710 [Ferrimonas gelatinilytica]|uniref:Uncharacterized protein n=2 Tax=Ferrimonas gelatinilytica TaxID=1255257 RepID=A0ABP9RU71_9GAMM
MGEMWLSAMVLLIWMLPGLVVLLYPRRCGTEQVGWILAGFGLSYLGLLAYQFRRRCNCIELPLLRY